MPGFKEFVEGFFRTEEELALCQIVGHSYDLDTHQMWELFEDIIKRISEDETILPMTHGELVEYLQAMQAAELTEEGIVNASNKELWFEIDEKVICVKPGQVLPID